VPPRRGQPLPAAEAAADTDAHQWDDDQLDDDQLDDDQWDDEDADEWDDDAAPVRRRDPLWQRLARGAGELLVTAGLIVLLFVVYEVYVTDWINGRQQSQLSDQIHDQWADTPSTPVGAEVEPAVGQPLAVLHIPRLGADWSRVVLEGTAEDELSQGPGHYIGTAMPGQLGNLALAGHRVGKGSPFLDADQLLPGDPIVVETAGAWYVYRVLGDADTGDYGTDPSGVPGQLIVTPSDVSVIAPTPGGTEATQAFLTLTTCHPKYSARQRLIVHAVLQGAGISKADEPDGPPELKG